MNSFYGMNPTQMMPQYQQAFAKPYGIDFVYGEEGAKAYPVAPGNTMYLIDKDNCKLFIKGTDLSGNLLPIETYKVSKEEPQVHQNDGPTRDEFTALNEKVEKLYSIVKNRQEKPKVEQGGHE